MKEFQNNEREIINSFNSWTEQSKSKNYSKMQTLVLSNSDFHGLTYACQKSNETGINYFYEFDVLEIISLSKNNKTATIRGAVVLNMVCADTNYNGKFISTCCKDDSSQNWKLKDIEIEWE